MSNTVINDPNTGYRDKNNNLVYLAICRTTLKTSQVTVNSSTATALPSTPLAGRLFLRIYNYGTVPLLIGDVNVTTSTGWEVLPKSSETILMEDGVTLYGIVASGSADVRIQEMI